MTSFTLHVPVDYMRRLANRGAIFWMLAHMLLAVLMLWGTQNPGEAVTIATTVSPQSAIYTTFVVGVLAFLEFGIRRERIFTANLGISPAVFVVLPAAIGGALDCIIGLIRSAL